MNIIIPITITDATIGAGTTIAEPSPGEVVWASGTNYSLNDVVIRASTHRKYKCAVNHTSGSGLEPEVDTAKWQDIGPTNKFAPFDIYTSTAATATTSLTYVLSPGFFNAVALYGLTGTSYTITVKDVPGGAVIYSATGSTSEDPAGWYEYLFSNQKTLNKALFNNIPIRPSAELTITIAAGSGAPVGLGMIVCGDYASLFGSGDWGGTQYGAKAEPITYSYIKTNEDGTTTIVRRHHATNLRCTVRMPRTEADSVLQIVQGVLDVPVAWIASEAAGYSGLSAFGIGTCSMSYDSFGHADLEINVKGLI